MKTITLNMKKNNTIPLEFDNILPELLYDKNINQINKTIIYHGNRQEQLSDYFNVNLSGECTEASECTIIINGDLHRIKYIGNNMTTGKIIANGDVDLHIGAFMSGGHIIVNGNAESYAGREMTGGTLEINGNVQEFCGSSYAGEWRGMSGGKIIINGNAGKYLGEYMIGGTIHVKGNCDDFVGVHMSGGHIQIEGNVNKWPAGQMKNGTIIINGQINELLSGFIPEETINNPEINEKEFKGCYDLYIVDKSNNGKGNLWIKRKIR